MTEARAAYAATGATPDEAIDNLLAVGRGSTRSSMWRLFGDITVTRRDVEGVEEYIAEGQFVRGVDL